ncbi:sporulation initiation inhibitor protein Soj [bacterium BMS3Abin04]|nr:sporulation initiation inhibitor protein Soj [bacterium BMS3Abin04]
MGKIISIAIPKGGVGKTTTAVNLSLAMAKKGYEVLLVDVDPSGQCAASFKLNNYKNGSIFDVFSSTKKIEDVIYDSGYDNLSCIPMRKSSYNDEVRLLILAEKVMNLRYALSTLLVKFDFIIIDCPPSLTGTTTNILNASNSVLIPIRATKYSMDELGRILNHVKLINKTSNANLKIEGIVLTIDEPKTKISHKIKKELILKYPNLIFKTSIPKTIKVQEASFDNQPVLVYDPQSSCAKAYLKLADELILRNELRGIFFE